MKKILITDEIRGMAKDYAMRLLNQEGAIDSLRHLKSQLTGNEAKYVECIIRNLPAILEMLPWNYTNFHQQHFALFDKGGARAIDFSHRILLSDDGGSPKEKAFYMHIVAALKYDVVQQKLFPECVRKMGIRACVYCNAQYTNTVEIEEGGTVKGRYELDHFWPKDEYPFLCISFYNLQPSCSSCNNWKRDEEAKFNLYTDKYEELNPFTFELTPASLIRYMLRQDAAVLDIKLKSKDAELLSNHLERFHTDNLYKTYADELEVLVWKFKSFNPAFKEQLTDRFKKLFPIHATRNDIIRFLYGFYSKEKDVHKRPLTKVKQDVAKQLGMI